VLSLDVRRASPADLYTLVALNVHVQALHIAARPDLFKPAEAEALERWFLEQLAKTSTRLWLAEHEGVAVGYVLSLVREAPETAFCYARRWCELDQIAVAPDQRQRHVARRLIEAAVHAARDEGLTDVELGTWAFNQVAQSAFRRLGFTPKVVRFERKV
jgi:ribosomal protein S18 acetylase RimI-like enzyme